MAHTKWKILDGAGVVEIGGYLYPACVRYKVDRTLYEIEQLRQVLAAQRAKAATHRHWSVERAEYFATAGHKVKLGARRTKLTFACGRPSNAKRMKQCANRTARRVFKQHLANYESDAFNPHELRGLNNRMF